MTDTYDVVTNPAKPSIVKDPAAVLDYTFDWTLWLNDISDTITGTPVYTLTTGITKVTQSNTTLKTTIWISGGIAGNTYQVDCTITTAGGRTDSRSIFLKVKDR